MSPPTFRFICDESCSCGGCCARGAYRYEGYSLPAAGGWCGCTGAANEDPSTNRPSVKVEFSHHAVFYEESYTNSPGDVVARRVSTNVTVTCTASGGPLGGSLQLSTENFALLSHVSGSLPITAYVPPRTILTWTETFEPLSHSTNENDIAVSARLEEAGTGVLLESEHLI